MHQIEINLYTNACATVCIHNESEKEYKIKSNRKNHVLYVFFFYFHWESKFKTCVVKKKEIAALSTRE